MPKFAHMADCHIGAYRDKTLRELNLAAFEDALDKCIKEKVDFILIAGDLLDNNLPDAGMLNRAVRKMKEAREAGIRIYVVYGSHDYSPTKTSMIDILHSTGLFDKVGGDDPENPKLEWVADEKTGAKIAGVSARKLGLETKYFDSLDFSGIGKESGFKIFLFHSAVAECSPEFAAVSNALSASQLPEGFSYYASGHVHSRYFAEKNGKTMAFPGPTFGSDYRDLESSARGERKGFFIIEFSEEKIVSSRFVETKSPMVFMREYDVTGISSQRAYEEIEQKTNSEDVEGKIVLLKITGELSSGKPSDINFSKIKERLMENGALAVYINHNSLTSREETQIRAVGETREEIESNIFKAVFAQFKTDNEKLSKDGVALSLKLLNILKEEQKGGTKSDYEKRILENGMRLLGLQ